MNADQDIATEHVLAQLWCEVLQTSQRPGRDDDFFALGGDSMTMVMLEFRIAEEFEVTLQTGALLGAPTLRELSAMIDSQLPVATQAEGQRRPSLGSQ